MKHLVVILHAGDYLDAANRRAEGLPDRYRHHSYALAELEDLCQQGVRVTVVRLHAASAYDEQSAGGLRFVALDPRGDRVEQIDALLRRDSVTHVMVRSPAPRVIRAACAADVRVSVVLADSFPSPLRHRRRYRELGRLLRHSRIDFVSNHHVNASRQLVDVLGVEPGRVVPWDWPLDLVEVAATSRKAAPGPGPVVLCYVGAIEETKGIFDIVRALDLLRRRGVDARLEVAGGGDLDRFWSIVERVDQRLHVVHHGRIGGDEVMDMMHRSTFVCVPSHHQYPEGLPLTLYEAMASGTPVIASDHPMFRGVVRDRQTGYVFRARRPRRLAQVVERALADPDTYRKVSHRAASEYCNLGLDALWGDITRHWVSGEPVDREWLREHTLTSLDRSIARSP